MPSVTKRRPPPSLGHVGGAEWVPKGTKKVCMGMTNVTTRSPPKGTKKVCMGRTDVTKRSPHPSLGHVGGAELAMIPAPES